MESVSAQSINDSSVEGKYGRTSYNPDTSNPKEIRSGVILS